MIYTVILTYISDLIIVQIYELYNDIMSPFQMNRFNLSHIPKDGKIIKTLLLPRELCSMTPDLRDLSSSTVPIIS